MIKHIFITFFLQINSTIRGFVLSAPVAATPSSHEVSQADNTIFAGGEDINYTAYTPLPAAENGISSGGGNPQSSPAGERDTPTAHEVNEHCILV